MHAKISHSLHKKELLAMRQTQQHEVQQRQTDAMREAQRLAQVLSAEFGIHTVWLIGPLTYGQHQDGMPLELAVDGVSTETLDRALASLKCLSAMPIDLIDLAHADGWTRQRAAAAGKLLTKGA